jgi:hypothetical protein
MYNPSWTYFTSETEVAQNVESQEIPARSNLP